MTLFSGQTNVIMVVCLLNCDSPLFEITVWVDRVCGVFSGVVVGLWQYCCHGNVVMVSLGFYRSVRREDVIRAKLCQLERRAQLCKEQSEKVRNTHTYAHTHSHCLTHTHTHTHTVTV